MNKKLTLLATPMIILASSTASAEAARKITPYIGVDAQWRHTNFRKGFGDNLFKHDYQQGNVYTGIRICNVIGIEVGYEATNKAHRTSLITAGGLSAGVMLDNPAEYSGRTHIKGPHINLVGFIPLYKPYELSLIASVGIARSKFTLVRHTNIFYDGGVPFTPEALNIRNPNTTFQQRKSVLRLGIGLEQQFCNKWGIRGMVIWENTHKFKMNGIENPNPSINVKNSLSYSLGAFANF